MPYNSYSEEVLSLTEKDLILKNKIEIAIKEIAEKVLKEIDITEIPDIKLSNSETIDRNKYGCYNINNERIYLPFNYENFRYITIFHELIHHIQYIKSGKKAEIAFKDALPSANIPYKKQRHEVQANKESLKFYMLFYKLVKDLSSIIDVDLFFHDYNAGLIKIEDEEIALPTLKELEESLKW